MLTGEREQIPAPERRRLRVPPLLPARSRGFRRPRFWEEILFIGVGYVLYTLIRNHGLSSDRSNSFDHANDVLSAERWLHIDMELAINKAVSSVNWLVQGTNYYYATMHFAVTIGVLLWLYFRHATHYRGVRTALYVTNYVALLGFWLYPLTPPRMLSGEGYIDTVIVFHTWGSYGSSGVESASNQFAAMPSLHCAWALWCGIVLIRLSTHTWLKVLGVVYPVMTVLVVMATANHYILDAVGGVVVLAIGFGAQRLLFGRPAFADPPELAQPAKISLPA